MLSTLSKSLSLLIATYKPSRRKQPASVDIRCLWCCESAIVSLPVIRPRQVSSLRYNGNERGRALRSGGPLGEDRLQDRRGLSCGSGSDLPRCHSQHRRRPEDGRGRENQCRSGQVRSFFLACVFDHTRNMLLVSYM